MVQYFLFIKIKLIVDHCKIRIHFSNEGWSTGMSRLLGMKSASFIFPVISLVSSDLWRASVILDVGN